MIPPQPPIRSFVILGLTQQGKVFRPSDWVDRLCGVMAGYRPGAAGRPQRYLGYSPYVTPGIHEGVKCGRVDARIHEVEPLAYHFLVGFARDNDLRVLDAD